MKMKYSKNQLDSCVRAIWIFNPAAIEHYATMENLRSMIFGMALHGAKDPEMRTTGTMGFMIDFSRYEDDPTIVEVDFLIDPTLLDGSLPMNFDEVEI